VGDVIAVIGGTGFIGQAVARAAVAAGHQPVLLGPEHDPAPGPRDLDAPHVRCDIADRDSVDAALEQAAADAVVHLAAFGAGAKGLLAGADDDPATAVTVNVGGFVNVVEAAGARGIDRVVWSSSTTVYGPAADYGPDPVREDVVLAPQSVYGATKAAAELLSPSLQARSGCRAVGLRLPLVYGPGRWYGGSQEGLVGFVADVAAGRPAHLAASELVADWIYVDDAADAVLAALAAPAPRHAYNLVGHRASLADVGRAVASHATAPAEVEVEPHVGLTLPASDDAAARADLGFAPRFDLPAAAADYLDRVKESA
jgi:nucleoside-diphosphate-sugar epimerase